MPWRSERPARSGLVPPLAKGFSLRDESVAGLEQVLLPGKAVVLAPAQAAKVPGWQSATGRTQLAVYAAQSLRWPGGLDLVAWVTAASRATILSGYAEAALRPGLDQSGGEAAAARFAAWLWSTQRPWLVVLDDLRYRADLEGLWPAGAAGRLLITAADPETAGDGVEVLPVGCLTPREALRICPCGCQLIPIMTAGPGRSTWCWSWAVSRPRQIRDLFPACEELDALLEITSELATNAVNHTRSGWPGGCFGLERAGLAARSGTRRTGSAGAAPVVWVITEGNPTPLRRLP